MNKYNATKTIVDGITFDSKKEARRYVILKQTETNGVISKLELQPKFILQEKFTKKGKKYHAITYKADFRYMFDGREVIEDVKGFMTETFKLKRKLFEYKYPELTLLIT